MKIAAAELTLCAEKAQGKQQFHEQRKFLVCLRIVKSI
jgi:hypothetical protein